MAWLGAVGRPGPMLSGGSDSREARLVAFFQDVDGEFAVDGGEAFQECIERIAVPDAAENRFDGDAGPAECRRPMHHFGVACDGIRHGFIARQRRWIEACRRAAYWGTGSPRRAVWPGGWW